MASTIIWSVKQGGNRLRRNRRKRWLLRRTRRRFLSPREASWKPPIPTPRTARLKRAPSQIATPAGAIEITLPARMDFEENYETTASRIQSLRNASRGWVSVRKLRFNDLEYISPAAALVLASEIDQWNQRVRNRLHANIGSWKLEIKRLLSEMGFFELLGLQRPGATQQTSSITFLNFIRGESGNGDSGKLAKKLRTNIEAIVGQGICKHSLFEGLSEAITNVSQHAYPPSLSISKKQWWLSASFDKQSRNLRVMFYDQGVGIPQTLPSSRVYERMKAFFRLWSDSEKIQAAMNYGRSSTDLPERGKGLKNLEEFAKMHKDGKLSIYSHRGLFRIMLSGNNEVTTFRRDHEKSVGGTLIEWSVKL